MNSCSKKRFAIIFVNSTRGFFVFVVRRDLTLASKRAKERKRKSEKILKSPEWVTRNFHGFIEEGIATTANRSLLRFYSLQRISPVKESLLYLTNRDPLFPSLPSAPFLLLLLLRCTRVHCKIDSGVEFQKRARRSAIVASLLLLVDQLPRIV